MDTQNKLTEIINSQIVVTIDGYDLSNASYEELVQLGGDVSLVKTYTQWILGKLADTVAVKYGDIKKYAKEIRQNYGSLRQYMYTYRKFVAEDNTFNPANYYGSVPWGVLALAATKTDKPQQLINNLVDENKSASIESAYREIKRLESPESKQAPRKPQVSLQLDKTSNLYKLIMNPNDFPSIDWTTSTGKELKDYLNGLND